MSSARLSRRRMTTLWPAQAREVAVAGGAPRAAAPLIHADHYFEWQRDWAPLCVESRCVRRRRRVFSV